MEVIHRGPKSNLDNPVRKKVVISKIASGENLAQIGRDIGVSRQMIHSWVKNRDDIKELIEKEQMRLLDKVPDAVEYVKSLIPTPNEDGSIPEMEIKDKELAYKASGDVLRAAGIMPSTAQSQVIMNIYQENSVINPVIMQLLEDRDRKFLPIGDVVDVVEEEK